MGAIEILISKYTSLSWDIEEIRHSRFGLSDEESSGSAQGAILKEEFLSYGHCSLQENRPFRWFTPTGG